MALTESEKIVVAAIVDVAQRAHDDSGKVGTLSAKIETFDGIEHVRITTHPVSILLELSDARSVFEPLFVSHNAGFIQPSVSVTESERIALPLIEKLIAYRDGISRSERDDRELLADACNTISSLRSTCTDLRQRIAALEAALEPFAALAREAVTSFADDAPDTLIMGVELHHFRRLLAKIEEKSE